MGAREARTLAVEGTASEALVRPPRPPDTTACLSCPLAAEVEQLAQEICHLLEVGQIKEVGDRTEQAPQNACCAVCLN
jgi:hypothetical protein